MTDNEKPEDGRIRIWVNSNTWMSRGKYAAAAVHAALTAAGVHPGVPVIVLGGHRGHIERMRTVIRDAGRTEVAPGTTTAGTDYVFEKAHTPTTDERQQLDDIMAEADGYWPPARALILERFRRPDPVSDDEQEALAAEREEIARIIDGHVDMPVSSRLAIARSLQGNGFRRSEVPEPSAVRETLRQAMREAGEGEVFSDVMSGILAAALRAAGEVNPSVGEKPL